MALVIFISVAEYLWQSLSEHFLANLLKSVPEIMYKRGLEITFFMGRCSYCIRIIIFSICIMKIINFCACGNVSNDYIFKKLSNLLIIVFHIFRVVLISSSFCTLLSHFKTFYCDSKTVFKILVWVIFCSANEYWWQTLSEKMVINLANFEKKCPQKSCKKRVRESLFFMAQVFLG